jgi:hypothetical protein
MLTACPSATGSSGDGPRENGSKARATSTVNEPAEGAEPRSISAANSRLATITTGTITRPRVTRRCSQSSARPSAPTSISAATVSDTCAARNAAMLAASEASNASLRAMTCTRPASDVSPSTSAPARRSFMPSE